MNTKVFFVILLLGLSLAGGAQTLDASRAWDATNKRWTGPTAVTNISARWSFTARTGFDNLTGTKYPAYYVSDNINGYMEYLPEGYNLSANSSKTYPLIIYFPGCGETGNTGVFSLFNGQPDYTTGLARLFGSDGNFMSLPYFIRENGRYFSNIKVKKPGTSTDFGVTGAIIICANYVTTGFCSGASPASVYDMLFLLEKMFTLYRVDKTRVYMTGMSQGGGINWIFPTYSDGTSRYIAGSVPVCATETIYQGNEAIEDLLADVLVRNGVNVLPVANKWDWNNDGRGGRVIDYNRASIKAVLRSPKLAPFQADSSFYLNSNQTVPYTSPRHDSWVKAYHPSVIEYASLASSPLSTYGGPVWIDKTVSPNISYNTFEWMVSKQNLLTILPVKYKVFNVKRLDEGVQLDWVTAQEQNSSRFEVERSINGRDFVKIGEVKGSGNSLTDKQYTFQDLQLPEEIALYYRIKQVDLDGKFEYSTVKRVQLNKNAFNIRIYPNTTTGPLSVDFRPSSLPGELRITDLNGQVLMRKSISPRASNLKIDIGSFAKGVYILQMSNNNSVETSKIVKL